MPFEVLPEKRAYADIQQAISYYDSQQVGLGKKFLSAIEKHFDSLNKNPFFQIRYYNVRCLPVKKFPFMIHFILDEKTKKVYVISVLHTSQDPHRWIEK